MSEHISTGGIEIEWSRLDPGNHVVISGRIDDHVQLVEFAQLLKDSVVFDLEHVRGINSLGTIQWIKMLSSLQERGVIVKLKCCSEAMVLNMNMCSESKGNADVESLFAPYRCNACDYEASMCLEVAPNLEKFRQLELPALPCSNCESLMEFDDIAEEYLLFLK